MQAYLHEGTCPSCGRVHTLSVDEVIIEKDAVSKLPAVLKRYGAKKIFVLSDRTTYSVAGETVCRLIENAGISCVSYPLECDCPEPDEATTGAVFLHYDASCDFIVGVGSGVINDLGKILSNATKNPYAIVATAPSMDGYASPSSSMAVGGVKFSVPSRCPDVIIGDIDILKTAPDRMLQAGLGDMLAKYVGLCEWRIGHLIMDEEYCEQVAALVKSALKKCVSHKDALLAREDDAIHAVFEGLVLSGFAMTYANTTRPASGGEHYISHIWDMRGLSFGTPVSLHGLQCGIGTRIAAQIYEQIKTVVPDSQRALTHASRFSYPDYAAFLNRFMGNSAKTMIALEEKEGKYDTKKHKSRLDKLISHWDEIVKIIEEEMPSACELEEILNAIGAPKNPEDIGIDSKILPDTVKATKDIRDKYVFSRILWDLGIEDEITF